MEHYDAQMAQRVWQRVQSRQADTPATDLSLLLQAESIDLSRYLQLQSTMGGAQKPLLQQLIQQTRRCISVLRGMAFLLTDSVPEIKTYPLPKELPLSTLRRCYGATLQRIREYEGWENHPEYGPGFRKLRATCEERCVLLLQIFGI